MAEVLKKFGRYFLLDHLAQGGMAEIYRARLASPDSAGRIIVIKKVIAGYGHNADFLTMFKSEIQVTMGFNHPNIVQVYDFGDEENQPYIAMEWVDGKNLKQFLNRFAELKKQFPIELATWIIEQGASGLHYAHSYRDKVSGVPLNIVHRDISPQNILISYEGTTKVIDFGIAKATTNQEATQAGIIKGKPSYLSPEQISGLSLDGRSDVFALGAVLWELLTGRKLFAGENDLAVLKLIEACQTHVKPPSSLNPKVPKELDYIVLRSLAKQREKRYQSAEEMQRALHKFLYNYYPEFNPTDLSYSARELFKNEIVEDRKKFFKLNERADQILAQLKDQTSATLGSRPNTSPTNNLPPPLTQAPSLEVPSSLSTTAQRTSNAVPSSPSQPRSTTSVAASPINEILPRPTSPAGGAALRTPPSQPRATQASQGLSAPATNKAPDHQAPPQNQQNSGRNRLLVILGALLALSWLGPQFGVNVPILSPMILSHLPPSSTPEIQFLKKARKKEAEAIPTVSGGSGANLLLRIHLSPASSPNTNLRINNVELNTENPQVYVPLDFPLELIIERPQFKPYRSDFVLDSKQLNALKEWQIEAQLEPLTGGYLTLHSTPHAIATMMIDGSLWKKETPIEREKIPAGHYDILLENTVLGMEKRLSVDIVDEHYETQEIKLDLKPQSPN